MMQYECIFFFFLRNHSSLSHVRIPLSDPTHKSLQFKLTEKNMLIQCRFHRINKPRKNERKMKTNDGNTRHIEIPFMWEESFCRLARTIEVSTFFKLFSSFESSIIVAFVKVVFKTIRTGRD